jgi:HK97 gp10 family phage protein
MQLNIEIKNLDKFRAALSQAPAIMKKFLNNSLRQGIAVVQRKYQSNWPPGAPVDTGQLKNRIEIIYEEMSASLIPLVEYAIYVHEGTRYMIGRPYLETSLEAAKSDVQMIFNRELEEALKEIARKSK